MSRLKLLRYGSWVLGSIGVGSASLLVTNCAAPYPPGSGSGSGSDSGPYPFSRVFVNPPDSTPSGKWDFTWDRRDPVTKNSRVFPKKTKEASCGVEGDKINKISTAVPKAKRNLILIRHGQYNQGGEDDSKHTLTKLGEEQAAITGKRLKETNIEFDSIVCSGMTRAIQTAEIILKNMGQEGLELKVKDQLLSEGPPCIPDPPYRNVDLWNPDTQEFFEHGARIEAGFRKYFHRASEDQEKDSFELIVCHGNVIRYCTMRALQFPPEAWLRTAIDHTSLTKFVIYPDGEVVLRGFGDSGHLPCAKATAC